MKIFVPDQDDVVKGGLVALVALAVAAIAVFVIWYQSTRPPDVTAGHVIDKWYTPAKDWTYMQPIYTQRCTSYGTSGQTCYTTVTGYIPIPEHENEYWSLKLQACENDKCRTGKVRVDHLTYTKEKLGVYYDSKV